MTPDVDLSSPRAITPADLLARGPLRRLGRRVLCLEEADSTQLVVRRMQGELPDGALVLAEAQSAGRGRMGRAWAAPPRSSVLLSVLLRTEAGSPLPGLSTALASVAVCEAVERVAAVAGRVRWPNDVVVGRRKLGGVLAEAGAGSGGGCVVALGVGLNCAQRPKHFDPRWRERSTSLAMESPATFERADVAAELVARLDHWLSVAAADDGPARVRRAWRARCSDEGATATLVHAGATWRGTIVRIEETGDLLVELPHGARKRFAATTTQRLWEDA